MELKQILNNIDYKLVRGNINIDIKDLAYDSRLIKKDYAFVALIGIDTDGHNYIEDAIRNGANCIIVCRDVDVDADITVIKIRDTRTQLSYLSANFFENPQDRLIKIGITGTKGKTSISWMIKKILECNNEKVGVIGTVGTYINGQLFPHKNTTPESYQIQKFMKLMVEENVKYLIMEASSQALKVGRINNINFDYGIFTNLSNDHIGPREHTDYDDYVNSKAKLFNQSKIGILNCDDHEYDKITKNATCKIYTYGTSDKSNLRISNINYINEKNFLGTEFQINGLINNTFRVSAPGRFSSYNATSAILLCNLLGVNVEIIKEGLEKFHVDGRCEIINVNDKFKIVIDFAHNKLSMESIIGTMKQYNYNRIITIFGCGGGRDRSIRYELGKTSSKLSDLSIITTDNPRYDDIDEIISDIEDGVQSENGNFVVIKDRKEAIEYALSIAQEKDIILLLGKGHETYQEIKGKKYPFNEKDIINCFLNRQGE